MDSPYVYLFSFVLASFLYCRGLLTESRLLSFSGNIPHRLYPQWAVRVLNLPALPRGEVYQTHEPLSTTVRTAYNSFTINPWYLMIIALCLEVGASLESLYKLGVHLSKMTQVWSCWRKERGGEGGHLLSFFNYIASNEANSGWPHH